MKIIFFLGPGYFVESVLIVSFVVLVFRDAGRPVKPPSGALRVFIRDEFAAEREKGTAQEDVFGVLTARWKEMGPREKQPYVDRLNSVSGTLPTDKCFNFHQGFVVLIVSPCWVIKVVLSTYRFSLLFLHFNQDSVYFQQ